MGLAWKNFSQQEKEVFLQQAQEDKKRYQTEVQQLKDRDARLVCETLAKSCDSFRETFIALWKWSARESVQARLDVEDEDFNFNLDE